MKIIYKYTYQYLTDESGQTYPYYELGSVNINPKQCLIEVDEGAILTSNYKKATPKEVKLFYTIKKLVQL